VSGIFIDIDDLRAHGRDERIGVADFHDGLEYIHELVRAIGQPIASPRAGFRGRSRARTAPPGKVPISRASRNRGAVRRQLVVRGLQVTTDDSVLVRLLEALRRI